MHGNLDLEGRPARRGAPGRASGEEALAGDQNLVDDVDDAIAGSDVGLDEARAADEHLAVPDADADALSVERLDGAAPDHLRRGQLALRDVVEQDRAELLPVVGERVE